MFYPVELLSHRQRGKLAACWLAATSSEKSFKKYYNSNAIRKINVIQICEEILRETLSRNGKSVRYSLYLSSQLAYGITRIHSYQIQYFQKELYEIEQKLDFNILPKQKRDDAFDDLEFLPIDLPLPTQNFLNSQLENLEEDSHILPGEVLDERLQIAMQDATCLDFGCLTDEEMDFMFQHDNDIAFDLRNLHISKETDILERMADIVIAEEEKRPSQEVHSPMLVDISKRRDKSKERISLTPQKRQPHQILVETPTKRRRLSFETTAATIPPAPAEDVAMPAFELPVEETEMLVSPQQIELDMELEPLHSNYLVINRHSKKSKIIDQKIALTDKQLKNWRQKVQIHCRRLDIPSISKNFPISAKNLLNQPSHLSMRWNGILRRNLFTDRTTEPFINVDVDVAPANLMQSQEQMRVEETISKLNFPMEDLSALGKTNIAVEAVADSAANILSITNIIQETVDSSIVPLPEMVPDAIALEEGTSIIKHKRDQEKTTNINNVAESLEDIDILLERQRRISETKHISEFSTISPGTSQPALTSKEILALLEVLWCNKPCVKFSELIPKESYTKEDAATAFDILLELDAQMKLTLRQTECYRTLWIWKND